MRRTIVNTVIIVGFLLSITIMDYPFIARLYNSTSQTKVVANYDEAMKSLSETEREQAKEKAIAYNERLADANVSLTDAFGSVLDRDLEYESILNQSGDGVMAIIEIPKIKESLPIYHTTEEAVLQKGVGHVKGSSLPVGGINIHGVLPAHRGLPTKRLFTDIDQLETNDIFIINVCGEKIAYKVYEIEVVLPEVVEPLEIKKGRDLVTLVTCTPYGVNSHRIYVHGERTEYSEKVEASTMATKSFFVRWWWVFVTILLLLWMVLLLVITNRNTGKAKDNNEGKE